MLHIDEKLTESVFNILCNALRDDGVLYASYKYGDGTQKKGDRLFNNYDESTFENVIDKGIELKPASSHNFAVL